MKADMSENSFKIHDIMIKALKENSDAYVIFFD